MTARPTLTPQTIAEYLAQLRAALRGADPALIQDALYDAEEHLRAELAEQPGRSEADMLAKVVGSYGAPEEVAEIYRDQEIKIQRALRPPLPPRRHTTPGRFFGVLADPRTYGALFYMLLSMATGAFYFSWAVTAISVSLGLSVLIIGIPIIVLFFGSVRMLSLVEGRIVETMLGVRMPRRPMLSTRGMSLWRRVGAMFTDPRSWSTLLYMLLMLPLGIIYGTVTLTLLGISIGFVGAPVAKLVTILLQVDGGMCNGSAWICNSVFWLTSWAGSWVLCALGVLMLVGSLHLVRGLGYVHGQIARHLLVAKAARE